jgi:hypothetical protein
MYLAAPQLEVLRAFGCHSDAHLSWSRHRPYRPGHAQTEAADFPHIPPDVQARGQTLAVILGIRV